MSSPADDVIESYKTAVAGIKTANAALVATLSDELDAIGLDFVSGATDDLAEALKGELGADAANRCVAPKAQEKAIGACEQWVADNVANGGSEAVALAYLYAYGIKDGTKRLHAAIAAAPPIT
jgi:hypothetical protein